MRRHTHTAVLRRGNSETRRRAGSQTRAEVSAKYAASILRADELVSHGKGSMFLQTAGKYLPHIYITKQEGKLAFYLLLHGRTI
jgi:hypothetical protein